MFLSGYLMDQVRGYLEPASDVRLANTAHQYRQWRFRLGIDNDRHFEIWLSQQSFPLYKFASHIYDWMMLHRYTLVSLTGNMYIGNRTMFANDFVFIYQQLFKSAVFSHYRKFSVEDFKVILLVLFGNRLNHKYRFYAQSKMLNLPFMRLDFTHMQYDFVGKILFRISLSVLDGMPPDISQLISKRHCDVSELFLLNDLINGFSVLQVQMFLINLQKSNSCLRVLDLSNIILKDEGLFDVIQIISMASFRLKYLYLSNVQANALGLLNLFLNLMRVAPSSLTTLDGLDLSRNFRDSLMPLNNLCVGLSSGLIRLRDLMLNDIELDGGGFYLAEIMFALMSKKCTLKFLSLAQNDLNDQDAGYIARAIRYPYFQLTHLSLHKNQFTEIGRKCLRQALYQYYVVHGVCLKLDCEKILVNEHNLPKFIRNIRLLYVKYTQIHKNQFGKNVSYPPLLMAKYLSNPSNVRHFKSKEKAILCNLK